MVFTLAEKLRPIYETFGIDLPIVDGNNRFELPMPATYVLQFDGTVTESFVYEDYTQRMEPIYIIECLKRI